MGIRRSGSRQPGRAAVRVEMAIVDYHRCAEMFIRTLATKSSAGAKADADLAARRASDRAYEELQAWDQKYVVPSSDKTLEAVRLCLTDAFHATNYLFLSGLAFSSLNHLREADAETRSWTIEPMIAEHTSWYQAAIGTAHAIAVDPTPAAAVAPHVNSHVIASHRQARAKYRRLQEALEPT